MKNNPLIADQKSKLAEYGLENIPFEECMDLHFKPGDVILWEGEEISKLLIVMNGKAKVCKIAPSGKSLILCYYISEGIIGEVELLTQQKNASSTVAAISDFDCISISYQSCQNELNKNIKFLHMLSIDLAVKLTRSSDNYAMSALYTGEERLCAYILQNSHQNIFNDILMDTACSLGTSYRHIFRLLGQLCEEGILKKIDNGYLILNRNELIKRSNL